MKKLYLMLLIMVMLFICVACDKEGTDNSKALAKSEEFMEKVAGKKWWRGVTGCTEYIYFTKDGSYGYYEACGSPVGIHDLYNEWEYDVEKDVIELKGYPGTADPDYEKDPELVKYRETIEYVSCDGEKLVMIIDDEERTFKYSDDR